jgi:hypothetical protein
MSDVSAVCWKLVSNKLDLKEIQLMLQIHSESHRSERIGWLRAAVLGANDGTISVASLVVGVAVSGATQNSILLTGVSITSNPQKTNSQTSTYFKERGCCKSVCFSFTTSGDCDMFSHNFLG